MNFIVLHQENYRITWISLFFSKKTVGLHEFHCSFPRKLMGCTFYWFSSCITFLHIVIYLFHKYFLFFHSAVYYLLTFYETFLTNCVTSFYYKYLFCLLNCVLFCWPRIWKKLFYILCITSFFLLCFVELLYITSFSYNTFVMFCIVFMDSCMKNFLHTVCH